MNKKYTADGKKVVIVGQINNTDFIVQEIFVTEDGSEIPSGEKFVTKNLLDKPAKTWLERHNDSLKMQELEMKKSMEKIAEATRLKRIELDSISEIVSGALKTKNYIDSEQFDTSILANFLCGNIKYLVMGNYFRFKIVEMSEAITDTEYGRFDGLKLASVMGGSEGDISYRIHRYSDHSGSSEVVYPFNNLEDAKEKLKQIAVEGIEAKHFSEESLQYLETMGITLDEDSLHKYKTYQERIRKSNIETWKKRIEEAKKQIELLQPTTKERAE